MNEKGLLYLVATPIGNLEDITLRAIRILKEVDIIAAEDTRHTAGLLNHFEIKSTLTSYHEHNKIEKGNFIIQKLLEGKNVALVSDAGTPGISDPGEDLVKLAMQNDITISMAPGPVAAIMGLVLSGFDTSRFIFEGFLPVNKKERRERLSGIKEETRSIIFYEAPHKLKNTLKDLFEILGDRNITVARELTKKYEEFKRITLSEAILFYSNQEPKGEYVLVLEGMDEAIILENSRKSWQDISLEEHMQIYLKEGLMKKEAMKKVAIDRGISKRDVYNMVNIF